MPNWDAYAEAEKRGILPADKQTIYDEAKRRGLVPGISEEPTAEPSKDPIVNTEKDRDMEWREVIDNAIKNMPGSSLEMGKAMAQVVTNPIGVGKTMGSVVMGGLEKILPGDTKYFEKNFDAVIDFYKERYGDIESFKQTLAKDPVGVMSDAASFLVPSGGIIKGVGVATKTGKLAQIGGTIARTGARMDPYNVVKGVLAQPLKLLPEKVPRHFYQSAAKFSTTLPSSERDAITRTALDASNQIMPTMEGMKKLRSKIDDFNQQVNDSISPNNVGFYQMDVSQLRKGLDDLKTEMLQNTDEPSMVESAFKKVNANLDKVEKIGPTREPWRIQKIKVNIYKELQGYYEKQKASPARVESRKAVARNARQMLEDIVPEIKELNQKEGALIELWDAVESKANRISQRDLIGIGLPIKVASGSAGGYALAGQTGAAIGSALGLLHGIIDSPQIKSKLAIVLSRLKQQGIQVIPTKAGTRLGLFQAGRMTQPNE